MPIEIILSILAAGASLATGASIEVMSRMLREFSGTAKKKEKNYAEKLSALTENLKKASREVDAVLAELAHVARDRASAVTSLEADLRTLEDREKELKEKIEVLEKTPLPVAEHFAMLLENGEKRGARRDYVLFAAGVGVTTAVAIVIEIVRLG
jgi:predicted  nucleic acid-binding Zn-ribbon protein